MGLPAPSPRMPGSEMGSAPTPGSGHQNQNRSPHHRPDRHLGIGGIIGTGQPAASQQTHMASPGMQSQDSDKRLNPKHMIQHKQPHCPPGLCLPRPTDLILLTNPEKAPCSLLASVHVRTFLHPTATAPMPIMIDQVVQPPNALTNPAGK